MSDHSGDSVPERDCYGNRIIKLHGLRGSHLTEKMRLHGKTNIYQPIQRSNLAKSASNQKESADTNDLVPKKVRPGLSRAEALLD